MQRESLPNLRPRVPYFYGGGERDSPRRLKHDTSSGQMTDGRV